MGRSGGGVALIPRATARCLAAAAALGVAALAACATTPETPEERLRRSVPDASRVAPDAIWVAVEAESEEDAWGEVVRARTEEPREASFLLARAFAQTHARPREIVVGGPYQVLTEQVLRDALSLVEGRLEGLRVVQVSPDPPSEELVLACGRRGAICRHEPWRPPPED